MTDSISFEDFLGQQLEDVDFREDWERTALARSVADQVIRYRICLLYTSPSPRD